MYFLYLQFSLNLQFKYILKIRSNYIFFLLFLCMNMLKGVFFSKFWVLYEKYMFWNWIIYFFTVYLTVINRQKHTLYMFPLNYFWSLIRRCERVTLDSCFFLKVNSFSLKKSVNETSEVDETRCLNWYLVFILCSCVASLMKFPQSCNTLF